MVGVGQRIGNYRVLRKLGQGGMGAVYEALQEEIGRRAALKVLHPEYAKDQQSIQRFFNEARAVNIIHHAGLVGVFESGRLEDGGAYIVMEYLDGLLLSRRLEQAGQLGQRDVLNFGRQIASALAAAHAKGIVHRDLKPDNVMIVSDPETTDGERVKIFDFGIAKLRLNSLAPELGPSNMRTQTGMIMGTPTHMAPEQCRGASDISGKADVYSLGVILYQMLVGHPPFVADSAGELMSMHLRDKPPSLRKLDPSIPEELADLVHSMLAKEPSARPDMDEVVIQLESQGAYRTRRSAAPRPQAALGGERPKKRGAIGPVGQALEQTQTSAANRRFAIAIVVAGLLVVVSGAMLFEGTFFEGLLPSFIRSPQTPGQVVWVVDSEPPGAFVVRADTREALGRTPWRHSEPEHGGILRINLEAPGYLASTVILNHSQSTSQKVPLERITAATMPAAVARPDAGTAPTGPSAPSANGGVVGETASTQPVEFGKRMRWQVSSHPRGAEVLRAEDGFLLGRTPWKREELSQPGVLRLILRLPGYQDTSAILDLAMGNKQTVTLQPIGGPKVEAKKPPETSPPTDGKSPAAPPPVEAPHAVPDASAAPAKLDEP